MARNDDLITRLLENVFQQAPLTLHHVFALDGANETLASLKTIEGKVAYLLQMIALELHKASKEINPTKMYNGPNDIKFHVVKTDRYFKSVPVNITVVDLAEFEDLYYATCAKLKELFHGVEVRLVNGFKASSNTYFAYHCSRLNTLGPVSLGDFRSSLLVYESILYSDELTEVLNSSVIGKSKRHAEQAIRKEPICDYGQLDGVYHGSCKHTIEGLAHRCNVLETNLGGLSYDGCLQDMKKMSCSMIYGSLAEKYRPMMIKNEALGYSIHRLSTPDAPQAISGADNNDTSISPYNLEQCAEEIAVPQDAEIPYIYDPKCPYAAAYATDLTQNCLYEENDLPTCVTQGMDLNDLDIPGLVRYPRRDSETSCSSIASIRSASDTISEPLDHTEAYSPLDGSFKEQFPVADGVSGQRHWLIHNDPEIAIGTLEHGLSTSLKLVGYDFWDGQGLYPPRISSLAYSDALLQPFSKPCNYPPKRTSITQRLFFSRGTTGRAQKEASKEYLGKKPKPSKKRSFTEMSFTGLKIAFRRDSPMSTKTRKR